MSNKQLRVPVTFSITCNSMAELASVVGAANSSSMARVNSLKNTPFEGVSLAHQDLLLWRKVKDTAYAALERQ